MESVLLAALLSEEPLLLVGAHGCAKSFVLERLAEALGLAFRAYNASLINYDDLVGVPMPDASRTKLDYLASPESIWDAEVVFIDEISRTRPELQNKLFPIVYERRVQGRPLAHLVYRWAAMNPPPTDDELSDGDALYLGSEPLDAALADRARRTLNAAELTAICKTAWELSMRDEGDPLVRLMRIDDPVRRLRVMIAERLAVSPDRAAVIIGEGVAKAKPHLRRGRCRVHVFSTVVRAADVHDLAAHRFDSTGGTDIDCVLRHVLDLPPRKRPRAAVIITDGFTERQTRRLPPSFARRGCASSSGLSRQAQTPSATLRPLPRSS